MKQFNGVYRLLSSTGVPPQFFKTLSANHRLSVDIVSEFINSPWDFTRLSSRPDIIDTVVNFPYKPWNWELVSRHADTTAVVLKHPRLPWDYAGLGVNRTMTREFFYKFRAQLETVISSDVFNRVVDIETAIHDHTGVSNLHPRSLYNWKELSRRDDVLFHRVVATIGYVPWDLFELSRNVNIDWKHVLAHPEVHWNIRCLSANPAIRMDVVLRGRLANFDWDFAELSRNGSITCEDISSHPELPWDYTHVALCPTRFSEFQVSRTLEDIDTSMDIRDSVHTELISACAAPPGESDIPALKDGGNLYYEALFDYISKSE